MVNGLTSDLNFSARIRPLWDQFRSRGESTIYAGRYLFARMMDFVSLLVFRRCVARYDGEHDWSQSLASASWPCIQACV